MPSMWRTWGDLCHLLGECSASTRIPYLEYISCKLKSCIRWNNRLFCGSEEPQRGFRDLWLHWGCALGRLYNWPQRWVARSEDKRQRLYTYGYDTAERRGSLGRTDSPNNRSMCTLRVHSDSDKAVSSYHWKTLVHKSSLQTQQTG